MMKLNKFNENNEFFDYGTGDVQGNDLFDIHTTGMSFYDDLLHNPQYMLKNKNLTSKIVYMTPKEYFQECGKIFNNNADKQIKQTTYDTTTIDFLKQVITKQKKKFPLPFLDYAHEGQEGRHRIYTAAEMTSWNNKFPVLIVDYADKDLQDKIEKEKQQQVLDSTVRQAVDKSLEYSYNDLDEFKEEVEYQLYNAFGKEVKADFLQNNDLIEIKAENGTYEIDINDIKIKEADDDNAEIDIDDLEDIDDWLKQHNIEL